MKGKIFIEFLDNTKKEIEFDDYFKAMKEQAKLLKDKKFMKNVNILQVIAI